MTILVTGGTGVFGSNVVRQLVNQGERPVVITDMVDTTLLKGIEDHVDIIQGDILDIPFLFDIVRKYEVHSIAHLVALMPPICQQNPPLAVDVNVKGTVNLLEVARVSGIKRFVYTGTKGIYGEIQSPFGYPEYQPLSELHPVKPASVYDATKYSGETLGNNYAKNYGIEFLSLRFGSSYGPGKLTRHGPMAIHSKIIENAMLGIPTVIPQGADEKDDMIYVKDVAKGIVCALTAKNPISNLFNIGTGKGVTIQEFAEAVQEIYPEANIQIGPGLKYMGKNIPSYYSVFDITRAKRELGYQPTYDLKSGIQDYIETMNFLGIDPVGTDSHVDSDLLKN